MTFKTQLKVQFLLHHTNSSRYVLGIMPGSITFQEDRHSRMKEIEIWLFLMFKPGSASTIPYFFWPKFRNLWSPVCSEETDWPFCIFGLIKIQLTLKLRQWLGYVVGSLLKHFKQSMSYTFLAVKNKLSGIHTQQTHFLIILSSLVAPPSFHYFNHKLNNLSPSPTLL